MSLKEAIDNNDVSSLKKILNRKEPHDGTVKLTPKEAAAAYIFHDKIVELGALHYAALTNRNPEIYKTLINADEYRYSFNIQDNRNRYPLHYFVFYEKYNGQGFAPIRGYDHNVNIECFCLLFYNRQGSPVLNVQDVYGRTPLHYVCDAAHLMYIGIYTASGADTTIPDIEGMTPLQCLINSKRVNEIMAGTLLARDVVVAYGVEKYFANCGNSDFKKRIVYHRAKNGKNAIQMATEKGFTAATLPRLLQ